MKKLLLILLINTAGAVEFGVTVGSLGAGLNASYKYKNIELKAVYTNTAFNYLETNTQVQSTQLLFNYYINNNFYISGGYITGDITTNIKSNISSDNLGIDYIKANANYTNTNNININSPYLGIGYKSIMSEHWVLDVQGGIVQTHEHNMQNVLVTSEVIGNYVIDIPMDREHYYPILNVSINYKF
jgi:hypothetical protein